MLLNIYLSLVQHTFLWWKPWDRSAPWTRLWSTPTAGRPELQQPVSTELQPRTTIPGTISAAKAYKAKVSYIAIYKVKVSYVAIYKAKVSYVAIYKAKVACHLQSKRKSCYQ